MTGEKFMRGIEGTVNDVAEGLTTRDAAVKSIADDVAKPLEPLAKSRQHLELFIYRVQAMRKKQQHYFAGYKNALTEAKKLEDLVDKAIKKLVDDFGYDIEKIKSRYEQKRMF